MKIKFLLFLFLPCIIFELTAQNLVWQSFVDSIPTFSSPRAVDLNGDGVLDIILGGGTDGVPANNGIMAFNGADGSLLWKRPAHDEIFVSANFQDINGDGVPDVFIGGREAQLYAIDGSNGSLIWQFYPHPFPVSPGDSGLWNFYSPQFIPDVDGDALPDLLVANGGDHSLPLWETNRPPGHLMVISSATGSILAQAVVPDSAETYCSPLVIDLKNDGTLWILYGTGGESLGGSFYAVQLEDLLNENLENSIQLATHPNRGFIAPASAHQSLHHAGYDFIVQGFGGTIFKFDGSTFAQKWATTISGAESSAQPVIGNFTGGDHEPDVFCVLYKGSMTSYTDYYQVMLDGTDGSVQFKDSLGTLHFPSGNAVDLNNDGRDEAIVSITYHSNGYFHHKLQSIDFQNNTVTQIHNDIAGTNLGSTPLIADFDNNGLLDIVYVVRRDSINPVGWKGIHVFRYETDSEIPNAGIAWGSYIGSDYDGIYQNTSVDCGVGSVISTIVATNLTCNNSGDGSLLVQLNNPADHHTYLWSTSEVTSEISNLSAGQYEVRVTNDLGCYEDYFVTLSDPYVLTFGGIHPPTCPGENNGMATVSSTGCPCMFNTCVFTWENGVNSAQNLALSPGMNTVTIEHPDGCIVTDSVWVPESAPLFMDTVVVHNECFNGNTGMIEVIGNPNYTTSYSWSIGAITPTITSLGAGEYTLTISDNRPCSQVITFTVNESDSLYMTHSFVDVTCFGGENGQFELFAHGGEPGYLYSINGVEGSVSVVNDLSSGTYPVFVIDANDCESATTQITIGEPNELEFNVILEHISCHGATDGMMEITATGGTPNYTYIFNGNSFSNQAFTALEPGIYSITVTDENGCSSAIESHEITEPAELVITISATDESSNGAGDGTATVVINGGTAPYAISWDDAQNQTSVTAIGLSGGTYTVTVTDANGCEATATISIGILSLDNATHQSVWSIYPNPARDVFHIEVVGDYQFIITDMNGKTLIDGNTSPVNTTFLSSGVYLLRIQSGIDLYEKKLVIVR